MNDDAGSSAPSIVAVVPLPTDTNDDSVNLVVKLPSPVAVRVLPRKVVLEGRAPKDVESRAVVVEVVVEVVSVFGVGRGVGGVTNPVVSVVRRVVNVCVNPGEVSNIVVEKPGGTVSFEGMI